MQGVVQQARLSKVTVVQGGGSRHRSIMTGLEALADDPPDVVVVHDGVRPILPLYTLTQVVSAAERYGAAGAVRPLVSTVVKPDSKGFLQESLVRNHYRNSEMPQAFSYTMLREAYRRCSEEELEHGTECLAVALHHAGVIPKLVPGTPHLWKVTEERDLVVARSVMPRHTRGVALVCRALQASSSHPQVRQGNEDTPEASRSHKTPSETDKTAQCYQVSVGLDVAATHRNQTDSHCSKSDVDLHSNIDLKCDSECLYVITTLESSLRSNSKHLYLLSDFDHRSASSSAVIVVSVLDTVAEWRSRLQGIAQGIGEGVCTAVLIFTLRTKECDETLTNVTVLQKQLREIFKEHLTSVTALLQTSCPTSSTHSDKSECQGAEKKHYEQNSPNSAQTLERQICQYPSAGLENCEESSRLVKLVNTLLDQTTRCFHGQILVL
ncbi:uncharacterized protein [Procambarus clarkii]|uniref:uncharacterized protein n=1 Tax=Procambarus clarkii TaxID=6728 RepID=UPI0037421F88